MFSSKEQLDKKTGPYGIGRLSYLQSLVTEFQDTNSLGEGNRLARRVVYVVGVTKKM